MSSLKVQQTQAKLLHKVSYVAGPLWGKRSKTFSRRVTSATVGHVMTSRSRNKVRGRHTIDHVSLLSVSRSGSSSPYLTFLSFEWLVWWELHSSVSLRSEHSLTYLLTYSMVQNPSWEANWFAASQELPRILWNPKVHYRTHKSPSPVPILGQPDPDHVPTSHLLEIHPNIIHPSMPRSPQWSLSLRFPHQDLYTPSPHPYAPHAQLISFFSILSPAQY